jgi:hypothetical protein
MGAGFSSVEVFRKYLWYLLRERQWDEEAMGDLVALKAALGLTDQEVGLPACLLQDVSSWLWVFG